MTRVSERLRFASTDNRIAGVRSTADEMQETAISGRRLRKMSTDPVSAVRVLRNRNKLENIQQFRRTLDYARGYLGKTEDSLRGVTDALVRAKELSVQQANGTWDAQTRQIVAEEVRNLADQVVQLGNSTYADKYVFGGFRNGLPPISPDGTYSGDDGVIFVQVDEDGFRPINLPGREIFEVQEPREGEKRPLVRVLRDLHQALNENDIDLLHSTMTRIDEATNDVVKSTALLGARQAAIEDVASRMDTSEVRFLADNNTLEGADPVASAMDLKRAEGAMQFTLKSSADIMQPTLLNFLK
ncbi:MAG: flagellar hook-associated protein FlgL [Silvanigrellales bacterium]|jgi:flagellar hook-associated protein 3 FlgL|nr:flagellar hook-associated protein FlgL [Silvanigrellales bacterium]